MLKGLAFALASVLANGLICDVNYKGRWYFSPVGDATTQWSGGKAIVTFTGTSLATTLHDQNGNQYSYTVDNNQTVNILAPEPGVLRKYVLVQNLAPGTHTLTLFKETEASFGPTRFVSWESSGPGADARCAVSAQTAKKVAPKRFEFIGDSLTCGYGSAGIPPCSFSADTERFSKSYATLVADHFEAESSAVSWSGKGMVRNYGDKDTTSKRPMPSFYRNTLGNNDTIQWDFTSYVPDAIVLYLGANDHSTQPHPPTDVFLNGYHNFIKVLRTVYPAETELFAMCGPSHVDPCCERIATAVQTERERGDAHIHYIRMPRSLLDWDKDMGCNGHPGISGHKKMAAAIIPEMEAVFRAAGWAV